MSALPGSDGSRAVIAQMLAAALFALLATCSGGDEAADGQSVPAVVDARLIVVTTRPFTETISVIGTVRPRAGHVATLSAPVLGRVTRVLVTSGERVAAGEPLVELDGSVLAAVARSAEAAVAAAERNDERSRRLVREGIASRRDAEQAAAELARARAELLVARRQAELATMRAPIPGVVTRMTATIGATADPTQPLVEIADTSALDLVFGTTARDAAFVRPGALVTLTSGESAVGDALGVGRVIDVGAAMDTATRTVPVRVRASSTARALRIGETVLGRIELATRPDAIVVPAAALVPDGDGFRVFVVDRDGTAAARAVTVGARADSVVEITSGLTPGLRIVTYGAYGVTDGARVTPRQQREGAPAGPP